MSENDDAEKEFEPTPQKLEQARKRGDLVRSADISVAAAYGGLLLALIGIAPVMFNLAGTGLGALVARPENYIPMFFGDGSVGSGHVLFKILLPLAPIFLVPAAAVLLSVLAQRALVFSGEKIMPKLDRIDPIANAKKKFGRSGLVEFLKSFVKLSLIAVLLGFFLMRKGDEILFLQDTHSGNVILYLADILVQFILIIFAIAIVMGGFDYLWQRFDFMHRNRMTRKELMDEMKQSEGDPHLKAQRRQKAIEIVSGQMLQDVAQADVVIVNPTHYAVALKWERAKKRAPICVAKGVDEIARTIREIAQENGVPIHSDPPTARALYATIEVDQEIHPEHYKPVAAAIRFAERMRRAARRRL